MKHTIKFNGGVTTFFIVTAYWAVHALYCSVSCRFKDSYDFFVYRIFLFFSIFGIWYSRFLQGLTKKASPLTLVKKTSIIDSIREKASNKEKISLHKAKNFFVKESAKHKSSSEAIALNKKVWDVVDNRTSVDQQIQEYVKDNLEEFKDNEAVANISTAVNVIFKDLSNHYFGVKWASDNKSVTAHPMTSKIKHAVSLDANTFKDNAVKKITYRDTETNENLSKITAVIYEKDMTGKTSEDTKTFLGENTISFSGEKGLKLFNDLEKVIKEEDNKTILNSKVNKIEVQNNVEKAITSPSINCSTKNLEISDTFLIESKSKMSKIKLKLEQKEKSFKESNKTDFD